MEQANAANFFELNNETLILKKYACRTYISPEKFLEYTGLSEGDTIVTSLNITLVAGTTTDNYFGRVMFWSKDTAAHPNLILTTNGSSRQLTIPEGFNSTNYGDMFFYGAKNADENGNLEAHVTEFMITKDLTATEYEPYGYKVPISIKGKNLFDIDAFLALNDNSAYYSKNENGELVQVKPDYRTDKTLFNYVTLPMGTYTISCSNTSITKSIFYLNGASTSGSLNRTFTITETSTVGFKFYESAGTVLGRIQIEEGEAVSEYESYISEIYNIYLDEPLRRIGDYSDYIDFINGKVIRNTTQRKVSDMQWSGKGTAYTTGLCRVQDDSNRLNNCNYNVAPLSNALMGHAGGIVVQANHITASSVYSNLYLYLSSSDVGIETPTATTSTAENYTAIMQYLIEKNVYICYALQEPTEETITLPKIKTGKGTNIIIVDTEVKPSNIEVQYYK